MLPPLCCWQVSLRSVDAEVPPAYVPSQTSLVHRFYGSITKTFMVDFGATQRRDSYRLFFFEVTRVLSLLRLVFCKKPAAVLMNHVKVTRVLLFQLEQACERDTQSGNCYNYGTNFCAELASFRKVLFTLQRRSGCFGLHHHNAMLVLRIMRLRACSCFIQVSSPKMVPFFREAKSIAKSFDTLELEHIERALNGRADTLANAAMDTERSSTFTYPNLR